jgi:Zn ribbon nucleic-acid-binding protein
MQAICPKCDGSAFRMLPNATAVECLNCGHVAPFVSTVAPQTNHGRSPKLRTAGE